MFTRPVFSVLAATLGCALAAGWWLGVEGAAAAAYGAVCAFLNAALLLWRHRRVESGPALSARQSLTVLYWSAFERFATIAALFALGMGWLRLTPLPLLAGFVVGQAVLLVIRLKRKG